MTKSNSTCTTSDGTTNTTGNGWDKLVPDTPLLFAGAIGGPCVMLGVTPFRNALSIAANDTTSSVGQVYKEVFRRGGWTGGLYPMVPAVPQFCVVGPMFHVFKDILGGSKSAVAATALCETMFAYGAETRNAQMAAHGAKSSGVRFHNPIVPFGPGVLIHYSRNILAMSGLRVLSDPCRRTLTAACESVGISGETVNGALFVVADLAANLLASAVSMPLHQLYGFTVTQAAALHPDKSNPSVHEQVAEARRFLRRQFLVPGTNRISRLAWRDIVLRCSYNATIFTVFGLIERTCVGVWKERGWNERGW